MQYALSAYARTLQRYAYNMRVSMLWLKVQGTRPTKASGYTAARENPRPPVGSGSDTRLSEAPGGKTGRGSVVRLAALSRAPARGGAAGRLGKAQRARLTDLGAFPGAPRRAPPDCGRGAPLSRVGAPAVCRVG